MTSAVEIQGVHKVFGDAVHGVRALDDVSISIRSGEFFTLLGPSGCGKTTLLRLIAGFESPTAGRLLLNGRDVTNSSPNVRPINTVFQSYALFPHLTVAENIAFPLEMKGLSKSSVKSRADEMLTLVKLDGYGSRKISELSGGQQQRVALARALAASPEVLLLDEPLSALDLKLRKEMQLELKRLQAETKLTFIFVTHDQEEALTMSDRIAVMSDGRVQQLGSPKTIYNQPANRFVAGFIGETNLVTSDKVPMAFTLPLVTNGSIKTGNDPSTLAFRPEDVEIVEAGGQGCIPVTVGPALYMGTDYQVALALEADTNIMARISARSFDRVPQQGSIAHIRVRPENIRVLGG
ncbi:ABC transporter ATP-binding protein [Aliihoeflea sp. PC F10.4]